MANGPSKEEEAQLVCARMGACSAVEECLLLCRSFCRLPFAVLHPDQQKVSMLYADSK